MARRKTRRKYNLANVADDLGDEGSLQAARAWEDGRGGERGMQGGEGKVENNLGKQERKHE